MDERTKRLREAIHLRTSEGWTIERLAADAGMRSQELHAYKSGRRRLTDRAAQKLAPVLGVPLTFLLAIDEEPGEIPEGWTRELLDEKDRAALEIYRALLKRDPETTDAWLTLGAIAAEDKEFRRWLKLTGGMAAREYGVPLGATEEEGKQAAPRRKKAKGA